MYSRSRLDYRKLYGYTRGNESNSMNNQEAKHLLDYHLQPLRKLSYAELKRWIQERTVKTATLVGSSKVQYQVEVKAFWDGKPNGAIRVRGAIDDGGWRAYLPITDDFIMAPDGSFVGE